MRLRGILLALLLVTPLLAACASVNFSPMFDLSKWTLDTYPAFDSGKLYDAKSPELPSFDGMSTIRYSPIFDMSPGSWSFTSFPKFA